MPTPISITDLENATLDVATIATVASVSSTASTVTNRTGTVIDTLRGRLLKLGYQVPVAYAISISFTGTDQAKTIDRSNILYAPYPSVLPFTTSGTWAADDELKFYAIQTSVDSVTTDLNDLITLTGVPANSVNLGTFTGDVVTDNLDIKDTIQIVGNAAEDTRESNWELLTTVTPTAVNKITVNLTSYSGYTKYKLILSNLRQNSVTPGELFCRINDVNTAASYYAQYFVAANPTVAAGVITQNKIAVMNEALSQVGDRLFGTIELQGVVSAVPTQFKTSCSYSTANTGTKVFKSLEGISADTVALSTFELLWSSSLDFNASGEIRVYGSKQ